MVSEPGTGSEPVTGAEQIQPGAALLVRDAFDAWLPATAASGIEGTHRDRKKIHDFPVVWVDVEGADRLIPWPVEDVRLP